MSEIQICTGQEIECGFTDETVEAQYKWGDPRRYKREMQRLLRIEQLAREVVNAQLALETPAFLKALESLRAELEGK